MEKIVDLRKGRAPKGIRLCNPLNIERSSAKWYGLVAQSREPRFCEFHTLEYGWRAAIINIAVTYRKRGWNTIRSIIEHWAPYPENDTAGYIDFVSSYTLAYLKTESWKTRKGISRNTVWCCWVWPVWNKAIDG